MFRLGLRLILSGGKEALARLLLITLAVSIGVVILLGILADFHAFQVTNRRPSWESTTATNSTSTDNVTLWKFSETIYQGKFIERVDVAPLGPNAPVLPGVSELPKAGQLYVSPALAELLKTVPHDELGDRFPGKQTGTIGKAALSGPNEPVVYVGRDATELAAEPGTIRVDHITTTPQSQGTTNLYRLAFGVGAIAILFPLLIFINTATQLAATRREERYAAMRLVGATPRQINLFASIDALVGASLGALLGMGIFLLLRPALADVSLSDVQFFAEYVTPTIWGYVGTVIVVPIMAMGASLLSLRRVRISPLGVSRKANISKPKGWRLIPLVIGMILCVIAAHAASNNRSNGGAGNVILLGLLLILVGITLSGSWLTGKLALLLQKLGRGAPSLLAARQLAANPQAAFRTVSGLVLAVFIGTGIAVLSPTLNQAQNGTSDTSLNNVMRVPYDASADSPGLQSPGLLLKKIRSYKGIGILPIYRNPAFGQAQPSKGGPVAPENLPEPYLISCDDLRQFPMLGSCAPGVKAVVADLSQVMSGDNPLEIYKSLPAITQDTQNSSYDMTSLPLRGILVKSDNPHMLEKLRTYITAYNAKTFISTSKGASSLTAWQMGVLQPETFGEIAQVRNNNDTNIEVVILAAVALTLLVAGCSLAVTIGGSLVERKRPFTLLRVSGVSKRTLYAAVLLEAFLPLLVSSLIAATIGYAMIVPLASALAPKGTTISRPDTAYYLTMGVGLITALLVVASTLPLLRRMTRPDEVRFE